MSADLLSDVPWRCLGTAAGAFDDPAGLPIDGWIPAVVPGTAAAAVRDARGDRAARELDIDGQDWWFTAPFDTAGEAGPWVLELGGLATIADVWVDGRLVLHSDNMFLAHTLSLSELPAGGEIAIRCAALSPVLRQRRPRGRWRTGLVSQQGLRWIRTTLLGRMPGFAGEAPAAGPWRPVTLRPRRPVEVVDRRLEARLAADGAGVIEIGALMDPSPASARLHAAGASVDVRPEADGWIRAEVRVPAPALWWPHTHGAQPRYPVSMSVDGTAIELGQVGFRAVEADVADGGFTLRVNGVRVFCRGACWTPLDPISLQSSADGLRRALEQVRDGGLNMVRVTGTMVYEEDAFYELCDELGLLVWQDAMLATLDPPEDEAFLADMAAEISQLGARLQGRPSITVISGGSETEQQPTMMGLSADEQQMTAIERTVPDAIREHLPDVPYVRSSPTGGALPIRIGEGVAHYFGVGGYLRPIADVRSAGVRFAAECLAFATPPERVSVDQAFGGASVAGHHPSWKAAVPRDAGSSWDFEDVRDHYVREIFGVDPLAVRYVDPERYLDLGRAAVCHAMTEVFAEWRRPGSSCAGGLVLTLRDLVPGAGWGLVDAYGRPKAPWHALRRTLAPVAALFDDRGLDGVRLHLLNDAPTPLAGELRLSCHGRLSGAEPLIEVRRAVTIDARSGLTVDVDDLIGRFTDVNHAFRFGPATYDALAVELLDASGTTVAAATHLALGPQRQIEGSIGLSAVASEHDGRWQVALSADATAQWVALDTPGYLADDSWFHLAPGQTRLVRLSPDPAAARPPTRPRGSARALNCARESALSVRESD